MPTDNANYTQGPENAAFDPSYSDGVHDDLPFMDEEPTLLDRSTLEAWAECPYSAANTVSEQECDLVLVAGQAAHDAISHALESYIQSDGEMEPIMLREELGRALRNSRPDIQPEVIAAASRMVYSWANLVAGIHPHNILAFDGGGIYGKSGQLAKDYPEYNARATSEVDFLYTGDSPEVVHEIDYKTGWAKHDFGDVAKALQFRMHAVLIFDKYPNVQAIDCRVWNTRNNIRTYSVMFTRQRYDEYEAQLRSAVETWHRHKKAPPTWPVYEKCQLCQCVLKCPAANKELTECESDPKAFLEVLAATNARLERMQDIAKAWVDKHEKDLVGPEVAYGRNAPKQDRKTLAKLYETNPAPKVRATRKPKAETVEES